MFSASKNKAVSEAADSPALPDELAMKFVRRFIDMQSRLAVLLQVKAEKLSTGTKKVCLFLFCLVACACSMYVITFSFSTSPPVLYKAGTIQFPKHIDQPDHKNMLKPEIMPGVEYQKVRMFQLYMDSLIKTASGRTIHDSILTARPGLMDSIVKLEKIFYSNFKNK